MTTTNPPRENSDLFFEKYKPVANLSPTGSVEYDGKTVGFETYGEDLQRVLEADPKHVWTMQDSDDGEAIIITAGRHLVNRIMYFITEKPWENEQEYYIDRVFDNDQDNEPDNSPSP